MHPRPKSNDVSDSSWFHFLVKWITRVYWDPKLEIACAKTRSLLHTGADSANELGSGVGARGARTFPDPVVASNSVTSNVLSCGAMELSKIKPDSGAEVNVPLFSRNDTNSSSPSAVFTVSMVLLKAEGPPGALSPEISAPGETWMSRTASCPVASATV